ncbi:protein FAR1-RELATED SEQUENCE 3-like isoform X2 [Durio zibethinus]|uniref:Protein FAR1-RELATED SEQUENCE 3-like isoform X2 n=1 Tax=Durio zibethinus TaxID=66656 RepID=A0A6P5Z4J7_DURZI|nr:protein FAR1-RELATED SEQUENCE 3-like isoform X2 [Durio zibethinus]
MAEDTLYLQLHKLSAVNSEEVLEQILTTLWKTRRSGLRPPDKSRIQSLLSLPSLPELDPVLACLRSLIRKCVHENFNGDDLLKLFPPGLSLDFQSILVLLLQKYASQWKEEIAKEQVKASAPPSFTPLPSSDIPTSLWPRQDDPIARINLSDFGASTPIIADAAGSCRAPLLIQQDAGPPDNLEVLPRLKSMTWTMENLNSAPANRVAIIHLKLQDYSKSPSGEIEVKFQLTKDTLEAMLRSMTYISEQLSNMVRMPFCILLWTLWSLRRVWRVRNSVFGS